MRRFVSAALVFFLVFLGWLASPDKSYAEGNQNAVNIGAATVIIGSVVYVEYERAINEKISLAGRVGALSYDVDYDEDGGTTNETGDGTGVVASVRFYPTHDLQGNNFEGFYLGGGVGVWSVDWEWEWTHSTFATETGSGSSTALDLNFNLGWKIPLGSDRVYIDPNIALGNLFISTESKSGDSDEVGLYAAAGLAVGITF
ncbi:MAG: hypothetical protein ACE5GF_00260 [Thermodesulfobacteriota bacterium]